MQLREYIRWLLVLALGTCSQILITLGFSNVYSEKIFHPEYFQKQFHSGVYQYRILSVWLTETLYPYLKDLGIYVPVTGGFSQQTDPFLFTSIFIINLFFCVLTCLVMLRITDETYTEGTIRERTLIPLFGMLVCAVSQFVTVPYDYSAWFFLLLSFLLMIRIRNASDSWRYAVLVLVFILSCFNRETAALSLSLWAAYFFFTERISKRVLLGSITGVLIFISIYLGIRYYMGSLISNDGSTLYENISKPQNLFGGMFILILYSISLFLSLPENRGLIQLFHLFSIVYLITCICTGILFEIRLYIPLFLISLVCGSLHHKTPNEYSR